MSTYRFGDDFKSVTLPITSPVFQSEPKELQTFKYSQTAPIINCLASSNPLRSTSSIDITSGSVSQSPYYSSLASPHHPPFVPDLYYPRRQQLRQRSHGTLDGGGLSGFIENRYSRFRPSDSHHNNEVVLSGMHPFQSDSFGVPKKTFFESMSNWFKPKDKVVAPSEDIASNKSSSETILISHEPDNTTPQPVYTPRGIPINEFPLNFNKDQNEEMLRRNEDIINSLDGDVRDLIDGVDNFLSDCIGGCWDITNSATDYCIEFC
ncbi:hypothetical protein G210_5300 [Candida maltosa Xu316]|uniref:Uncharacterized protein n=1 Tax=Candida maltosa (strain Xu316) TaxID=1245528 RepID=M3ITE6_CANMX|nr:hypothetical protein G210_5300 [Candida maltosa Xu316]